MKKKDELIIEMQDGLLNGVYSLNPTLNEVSLIEVDDVHHRDRIKNFWRNNLLVQRGCVSDIAAQISDEAPKPLPMRLEGRQLEELTRLFADNPVAERKLNFLEGFLYAWAMVNQKITAMCRSSNGGERVKGKEMYETFKPTLQSWLTTYDTLFEDLWQSANIDLEE